MAKVHFSTLICITRHVILTLLLSKIDVILKAVDVILLCRQKLNEKSQTRLADLEAPNDNGGQQSQDIDPIQVSILVA